MSAPLPRTATVRPPPRRAPRWAAASTPRARPLTTTNPRGPGPRPCGTRHRGPGAWRASIRQSPPRSGRDRGCPGPTGPAADRPATRAGWDTRVAPPARRRCHAARPPPARRAPRCLSSAAFPAASATRRAFSNLVQVGQRPRVRDGRAGSLRRDAAWPRRLRSAPSVQSRESATRVELAGHRSRAMRGPYQRLARRKSGAIVEEALPAVDVRPLPRPRCLCPR